MFVIAGATGHTGAVAAETLLAQGERVRVVVRDRDKAERFARKGADVAVADLGDAAALTEVLAGARGAYLLVPPSHAADFRAYQRSVSDAIVQAVTRAEVPHVVLLSSIGAQHPAGTGPIVALHELEARLRGIASLSTTAIRAASFMENLGGSLSLLEQGLVPSFLPADLAYEMIATADIGKLAASELREGGRQSAIIELGHGPCSANDVAATLGELLGKPLRVAEAPLDAVVPTLVGFGMQTQLAELYREMIGGIASGHVAFEGTHRRVRGSTPLRTVLAALLESPRTG